MPIVLHYNEDLELNLAEYRGSVSFAELDAVASFLAANPSFLKRDTLSQVLPEADFDTVPLDGLDRLFGQYKKLYAPMDFQIVRRSAWICQSPRAQAHVDHWLGEPNMSEATSSTLRRFASFAEAGDWLVLSEAETVALEGRVGFDEIARFDYPPTRAAAR